MTVLILLSADRYTEVDQYLCQRIRDLPYRYWNEEVASAHKVGITVPQLILSL